jgi:hypothetical protein
MSVETTERKASFVLNGVTSTFDFTFRALTATDIKAISTTGGVNTTLVYTTDYTVSLNSDGVGGTLTLVSAASTGTGTLTVYRETTDKQESDYEDYNQFPADTLETDLDRRTCVSQEKSEDLNRSVKMPITSAITGSSLELPEPTAGYLIGWDTSGTGFINVVNPSIISATKPLSLISNILSLGFNSTNLKTTSTLLNTIQDVHPTAALSFGTLNISTNASIAIAVITTATITNLTVTTGRITTAYIPTANVTTGTITNLTSSTATIATLSAGTTNISSITAATLVINEEGTAAWTFNPGFSAVSMGTDPILAIYPNSNADLKFCLASVTGGQRVYIWDPSRELPDIPHTSTKPTFAVYGDILIGDISVIESNPMTLFDRVKTNLPTTACTTLYCAQNGQVDVDGGAQLTLQPLYNDGGVVNDGYVHIMAYGLGTGTYGNAIRFTNRSGAGAISDRMVIKSNGKIGIGTNDPDEQVHIYGGTNSTEYIALRLGHSGAGGASDVGMEFYPTEGNAGITLPAKITGCQVSGNNNELAFLLNVGGVSTEIMRLLLGNVAIGTTTIETGSTKVLNIGNGTAPDAAVANQIQIYSVDSTDSKATLGLYLEQTVVTISTTALTHKVKVKVNGTEYWLGLATV